MKAWLAIIMLIGILLFIHGVWGIEASKGGGEFSYLGLGIDPPPFIRE